MKSWKVLAHDAFDTFATRLPCLWCRWHRLLWHKMAAPSVTCSWLSNNFCIFQQTGCKTEWNTAVCLLLFLNTYFIYSIPKACAASLVRFLIKYLQSEQPTCSLTVSQRIYSLQKNIFPHIYFTCWEWFLFCVSDTLTIIICVIFVLFKVPTFLLMDCWRRVLCKFLLIFPSATWS